MTRLTRVLALLLAGMVAVTLVACSSDGASEGTGATTEQGTTQEPNGATGQDSGSSGSGAAPAPADTAALDGKALVEERCTMCHPLTQATSQDGDAAKWGSIVDQMIGRGAQLTPEERQAVIDYLAETYPDK